MKRPFKRLDRRLSPYTSRRMAQLRMPTGLVSFSFDDAPHTACTVGRDVLESHGCRGTWYIAGGLTDQPEQGRMCHSMGDLHRLVSHGHHLGCHTFSHTPCPDLSTLALADQWDRNAQFLSSLGVPEDDRHFSFPLGQVDTVSKRLAARRFVSSRNTGGGLQVGRVDLNGLASERLYQGVMTEARLRHLLQDTAASRGWLIFYTHDVEPEPSEWGCTPALLDMAVDLAQQHGCAILPVNEVVRKYTQR